MRDELEWEKIRLLAYYFANGKFWTAPFRNLKGIMTLPHIDETPDTDFDKIRERIESAAKKHAELTKNTPN